MKHRLFFIVLLLSTLALAVLVVTPVLAGEDASTKVKIVGLYSETAAGTVSYRVGNNDWNVIKLGDKIPVDAEILITVERDWVELILIENPNAVYEIRGNESSVVQKNVADLLENEPTRIVEFPKANAEIDSKFTNKLVVKEYLGRQHYTIGDSGRQVVKYGDVLEVGGTVNIIGINNTLLLVLPNEKEITVVGPIRFTVENILKGENLYKYLNVQ